MVWCTQNMKIVDLNLFVGYRLGIGCLDGSIHILDMESQELVPKLADWEQFEKLSGDKFRHQREIVSMQWIHYNSDIASETNTSGSRHMKSYLAIVEEQMQKKKYDREYYPDPDALLVTADRASNVKFWMMDTICLLSVCIPTLLTKSSFGSSFSIRSIGVPENSSKCYAVGNFCGMEDHSSQSVIVLDLPIQDRSRLSSLATAVKQGQLIFDKWNSCVRQMQTEVESFLLCLHSFILK